MSSHKARKAKSHKQTKKKKGATMETVTQKPARDWPVPRAQKDDLQQIPGIGVTMENALNAIGVWRFGDLRRYSAEKLAEDLEARANVSISAKEIVNGRWIEVARDMAGTEQLASARERRSTAEKADDKAKNSQDETPTQSPQTLSEAKPPESQSGAKTHAKSEAREKSQSEAAMNSPANQKDTAVSGVGSENTTESNKVSPEEAKQAALSAETAVPEANAARPQETKQRRETTPTADKSQTTSSVSEIAEPVAKQKSTVDDGGISQGVKQSQTEALVVTQTAFKPHLNAAEKPVGIDCEMSIGFSGGRLSQTGVVPYSTQLLAVDQTTGEMMQLGVHTGYFSQLHFQHDIKLMAKLPPAGNYQLRIAAIALDDPVLAAWQSGPRLKVLH